MWVGVAAIVVGLALLGVCASQWDGGTGATMGRALSDYNGGDRSDLSSIGAGALRSTSQTGVEGLAGLFWLGIGVFLVRKARSDVASTTPRRGSPPRRR